MKIAYIIGKHENAAFFSCIDWSKYDSYGLNHAALQLKTKYGFTGHAKIEKLFIKQKKQYISTFPMFEGVNPNKPIDSIRQYHPKIASDFANESDEILKMFIDSAIQEKDFVYPQYWTILHCAIFYCLKHYDEIVLIGCANTKGDLQPFGSNASDRHLNYQRYHTDKLIELSPKKIWRCENINDLNL